MIHSTHIQECATGVCRGGGAQTLASEALPLPSMNLAGDDVRSLIYSPQDKVRASLRRLLPPKRGGFTLIEVMIAMGLFCMAMISIMGVMTRCLAAARGLQVSGPDAGLIAADLCLTNKLEDGLRENGDFGKMYPGYTWSYEATEVSSNGLFRVDFQVFHKMGGRKEDDSAMSILMYKPESPRSAFGGGGDGIRRR